MAFNSSKNYYEILESHPGATCAQLKCAYRRLARQYHPDINKSSDAVETFKMITTAYETLSDPQKRKTYDIINGIFDTTSKEEPRDTKPEPEFRTHNTQSQSQKTTSPQDFPKTPRRDNNSSPIEKLFKYWHAKFRRNQQTKNFHKPQKGDDITTEVKISPDEVITGSKRIINVLTTQTCPICYGRRFINGGKCSHCDGKGEISTRKKITVTIPKGIKDGTKLRLKNEGGSGKNGGACGDLYIIVKIDTKTKMYFDKLDIHYNIPITPFEAALGEEIKISAIDGNIKLKLPKNTCSGQKFRIAGQGIKKNGRCGDLIVTVSIEFSHDLSDDEIELYKRLKNLSKDDVRKNFY